MKVTTKLFGDIDIEQEKIIVFSDGIIGFPEMKNFALIVNEEKKNTKIFWLQSMDEGDFAMPMMAPYLVKEDFNPVVQEECLNGLGEFKEEDLMVFVTLNVPSDITRMYVNLKAPIVINNANRKACQVIVEEEQYPLHFPVYDILKKKKEEAGD